MSGRLRSGLRRFGLSLLTAATLLAPSALLAQANDPCADHVPQARPQNASRDIVGQELDQIMDRGFIEIAVYSDFAPYSWEEAGQAKGIDVEIGHLIAADLGVDARFRFVDAGENLDADLRNWIWKGPLVGGRVANVMMRVPYDSAFACRVEQVVFTGQYAAERIAIAYDKAVYPEQDSLPVPAYFRFDTVGVENDSITDFYLAGFAGGQLASNIRRYPSTVAAMEALDQGEVMAVMGPLAALEFGQTDKIGIHQPPLAGFAVSQWTLGVAINFRYRPLAYTVDDTIRYALEDGRIAAIFDQFGASHLAPER